MNAQIQYGSARSLTRELTQDGSAPPASPADRFGTSPPTSRAVTILLAGTVVLALALAAIPRNTASLATATLVGGIWLAMVLAVTLPPRDERAGRELTRRIADLRDAMNRIGDEPSRADLQTLLALAHRLGLRDEEIADELTAIHASLDALALRDALDRGEPPICDPLDPLPPGERCHLVCAAKSGRRRADHVGHLVLTSQALTFRGAQAIRVPWSEVTAVRRAGNELVLVLRDDRVLRLCCDTPREVARAGVLARHLADLARRSSGDGPFAGGLELSV